MESLESEEYGKHCFPPKDLIFQLSISVIFQFKDDYTGQDPYQEKERRMALFFSK
jgi:uracil DNA glycosylase